MSVSVSGKVLNFIQQHKGPFSIESVAALCDLSAKQVRPVIIRMSHKGTITKLDRGLYLNCNHSIRCGSSGDWGFTSEMIGKILGVIEGETITSARGLGSAIGYSRQYAFKYLEMLASSGCVGWDGEKYVVISKDISRMGQVDKGIIKRIKGGQNERSNEDI